MTGRPRPTADVRRVESAWWPCPSCGFDQESDAVVIVDADSDSDLCHCLAQSTFNVAPSASYAVKSPMGVGFLALRRTLPPTRTGRPAETRAALGPIRTGK